MAEDMERIDRTYKHRTSVMRCATTRGPCGLPSAAGWCGPSSSKYCAPAVRLDRRSGRNLRVHQSVTSPESVPGVAKQHTPQPFFDEEFRFLGSSSRFVADDKPSTFVRQREPTYSPPSITETGTLRPGPEWYPAWMKYRRREDNYVFWQDKFSRCSLDVPDVEKRWTLFSTLWFAVMEFKYFFFPPALRFLWFLATRALMQRVYTAHKAFVLWQCKLDAQLASKSCPSDSGQGGAFSRAMALRRLHWKNSLLGEMLYLVNLYKTGRINMLPPQKRPPQRPTMFWLF